MGVEMPLILVVDDSADARRVLSRLLSRIAGYETATAASGREALALIEEQRPDLVLLDISMPEMDGLEVLRRLRDQSETQTLPVAMVTALGDPATRARAISLGATDYFVKGTYDVEDLLKRLRVYLN